jgi:hypothetical protein
LKYFSQGVRGCEFKPIGKGLAFRTKSATCPNVTFLKHKGLAHDKRRQGFIPSHKTLNIYIDESGLFVPSPAPDSWNVVGAYVASERSRKGMELAVTNLKTAIGVSAHSEIKLKNLDGDPSLYLQFLTTLAWLDGVLYVAIADAYLDTTEIVEGHQVEFVKAIRKDAARMKGEGTRQMISILADQLAALRPQLYAQLFHQTGLVELVARSAILFFAQRYPATLQAFRWRIDRK